MGPVFARHLGNRLYRGEYFAIQCDAHVDFVKDWDSSIIKQWKSAQNEMAVLSAYLSDVHGSMDEEGNLLRKTRPIMCKSDFEDHGVTRHLRHGQQPEGPSGIHGEPTLYVPHFMKSNCVLYNHMLTFIHFIQGTILGCWLFLQSRSLHCEYSL